MSARKPLASVSLALDDKMEGRERGGLKEDSKGGRDRQKEGRGKGGGGRREGGVERKGGRVEGQMYGRGDTAEVSYTVYTWSGRCQK